ncbi:retrovirus-related pol polyprotein from transposon TNT 1-94, partial [Tanacetum coccineum]
GDEKAVGGKKVVKSNAKDYVFVYYAVHRGKEILDMPTVELEMSHLLVTLARMEQQDVNPRLRELMQLMLQGYETSRAPPSACQESPYPRVQHNKQKRDPLQSISQLSSHQPLFHPRLEQPRSI